MPAPHLVLLPGLDGTSRLYRWLVALLPEEPRLIVYPPDEVLSYDALVERTLAEVAPLGPVVLVAESFSGPIALRVAERSRTSVVAVVLIASFVESPTPLPRWTWVPGPMFRINPPRWLLRWFLLDRDTPGEVEDALVAAIGAVAPAVVASRLREILALPSPHGVSLPALPLLYIRASRDRLVAPRAVDAIATTGADLVVAEIEVAHLVAQLAPEAVCNKILWFVAELEEGSPSR